MAQRVETEAVVIQRFPYGESSQIVHLLTAALGRVAVMARGAWRSKNGYEGPLDLLVSGRVTISMIDGRDLGLLLARRITTSHPALRSDLARHAAATQLLRRVLHFETVGGGGGTHALLERALTALETIEPDRIVMLLLAFDLRLLAAHGLTPDVDRCVRCGSPRRLARFVEGCGGVVCVDCLDRADEGAAIDGRTATLLRTLLAAPLRTVAAPATPTLARARRLVDLHLAWHADAGGGRKPRAATRGSQRRSPRRG
ncbi:MAG: DNA repair protein RecO [Planctomycetes bacterium]|nr:DNA repair protein RecO [Planctomycetota bacterium]